jgi:AcrR family transcriptional regulator
VPRQGLTTDRVTAAAADLADSYGLDRLTIAAVARHFGVADASLYGHVRSREALVHQVAAAVGGNSAGHLRMIELSYATLRGYGIEEPGLTDAIRFVRSTLHGFAALETAEGFGHPRDLDTSWRSVIDAVHTALTHWPTPERKS